jgi:hypothetical protein
VFFDGINRVDLFFATPLLAALRIACPRGGLFVRRGLASLFTYIGYFFLIGTLGNAFDELFLVWMRLFAAGAVTIFLFWKMRE